MLNRENIILFKMTKHKKRKRKKNRKEIINFREELLSEATCTTVSSTLSLSSLATATAMIGVPDLEFPIDNSDNVKRCHGKNSNDTADYIGKKFRILLFYFIVNFIFFSKFPFFILFFFLYL